MFNVTVDEQIWYFGSGYNGYDRQYNGLLCLTQLAETLALTLTLTLVQTTIITIIKMLFWPVSPIAPR